MTKKLLNKEKKDKKDGKKGKPAKYRKKKDLGPFDKYFFYRESVQAPDTDVLFLRDTYKELKGRTPEILREDFCGTFSICCEWVKLDRGFKAVGVDLDPEPIEYGRQHYQSLLEPSQQERINILNANVLSTELPKADLIAALNFSYFIFKEREQMKRYFTNAGQGLRDGGLFLLDCFGGSQCQEANEEETVHDNFSYFWDQDGFDPVNNHGLFHIHFKRKGEKKRSKVFSYDWRMWTVPELRDILKEAGFAKTHVYWEGTTKDGEGDGNFTRVEKGEECESWIAYLVAEK